MLTMEMAGISSLFVIDGEKIMRFPRPEREKGINVDLFLSIASMITKFPEGYKQGDWGFYDKGHLLDDEKDLFPELEEGARFVLNPTICETPACLAGWAVFLAHGEDCLLYTSPSPRD